MTAKFGIIAITPALWEAAEPSIAVAAACSGFGGVIDLEFVPYDKKLLTICDKLPDDKGYVGIKCSVNQVEDFIELLGKLSVKNNRQSNVIFLTPGRYTYEKESLQQAIAVVQKNGLSPICEAISLREAKLAQELGAHAVVVKGQEAQGRVSEETSFVLFQQCVRELSIPLWLQGGVGLYTTAAAYAAGACGVVLDSQLILARESPLPPEYREKIARLDGTETVLVPISDNVHYRTYTTPTGDLSVLNSKLKAQFCHEQKKDSLKSIFTEIEETPYKLNQFSSFLDFYPLGQDVAYAATLANKFESVGAIINAIKESAVKSTNCAAKLSCFTEGSSLARTNRTKYPVLQGAMTRVSDTPEFALAVAKGGALPFLACALMRHNELEELLDKTRKALESYSWGVGILGFVPQELRAEQLEVIKKYRPPFALIAGGRPDQSKELEELGIKTYLHVPSPLLLKSFIEQGARRFIFEDRECGGHVGPRSSFVLWETMIQTMMTVFSGTNKYNAADFQVVFAGGIHDDLSAAMTAAIAGTLVERGVQVGVLLGTAYLFTKEAVETGAIVEPFQKAAFACGQTILLETGPGHAIRCIKSPYKETFDKHRLELEQEGKDKNAVRLELELANLGRLRIASKGLARTQASGNLENRLISVDQEKQWQDGMYMIGQVAVMPSHATTIQDLHESVCDGSKKLLEPFLSYSVQSTDTNKNKEAIAIIGMSCLFPQANNLTAFWENILNKVDAIDEIPKGHWSWDNYYDKDPLAKDKINSKWGGFLQDIPFDPSIYGIPPASLGAIDPIQLMILEVARAALTDAGYKNRPFNKERTATIVANAGHGPVTAFYSLRSMLDWTLSDMDPEYRKQVEARLPEWTEDSFAGYLGNVLAGRVANRLDFGGMNFCVDAACASSLAALYVAVQELRSGTSDMVLLAGADTHNQPSDYLSFAKTYALSPRGRCRTFDASADGIVISEGIGVVVLKRLQDAERDGDRIYALIQGIGASSDGRDLSLTAPRPSGQVLALKRAYTDAAINPSAVELIEAHGTGTVAGDKAEVQALNQVFQEHEAPSKLCAIGSVKTMIGHTKCAAGIASLIKITKALYHKVLPPTLGVDTPNPACHFEDSAFYINTQTRPWVRSGNLLDKPRRAGISAFGFGGTNFHTVLEEYTSQKYKDQEAVFYNWPSELFLFQGTTRESLIQTLETLKINANNALTLQEMPEGPFSSNKHASLRELAYKHYVLQQALSKNRSLHFSAAIVSTSILDLLKKMTKLTQVLSDEKAVEFKDPQGVFFAQTSNEKPGKIAFLFPGQGSQQLNMLKDLSFSFSEILTTFDTANSALREKLEKTLSSYVYPPPVFSEEEKKKQQEDLTDTRVAQIAIAAANMAALKILNSFDVIPDMVAGHSFGEYTALAASGGITEEELYYVAEHRGKLLANANDKSAGGMLAVVGGAGVVREIISGLQNIWLANINSPKQCILAGTNESIIAAKALLIKNGLKTIPIAVSAAFHSPLMEEAKVEFAKILQDVEFQSPQIQILSNTEAVVYPKSPLEIASLLVEHLVSPVEFQKQVESMYEAGARIFIECGPSSVLTSLTDDILEGKSHLSLSLERNGKHNITQAQFLLANLHIAGASVNVSRLYSSRINHQVSYLFGQEANTKETEKKSKLSYLINSAQIKKLDDSGQTTSLIKGPGSVLPVSSFQQQKESSIKVVALKRNVEKDTASLFDSASVWGASDTPNITLNHSDEANADTAASHSNTPDKNKEQVLMEFQRNMLEMTNNFLKTQERVMLAYLQDKTLDTEQLPLLDARMSQSIVLPDTTLPINKFEQSNHTEQVSNNIEQENSLTIGKFGYEKDFDSNQAIKQEQSLSTAHAGGNGQGKGGDIECHDNNQSNHQENKIDIDSLIKSLIEIISERTGYPPDMLDPALDLEADLGIDSIKRIEIFNSFSKFLPQSFQQNLESGIERLAGIKTLQEIIDWIKNDLVVLSNIPSGIVKNPVSKSSYSSLQITELLLASSEDSVNITPEKNIEIEKEELVISSIDANNYHFENYQKGVIKRATWAVKSVPKLKTDKSKLQGLYILTDDGTGIAPKLADCLRERGAECLLISHKEMTESSDISKDKRIIDLVCEDAIKDLFNAFNSDVNITGFIHLLPMGLQTKVKSWQDDSSYVALRSLFLMAKGLASYFNKKEMLANPVFISAVANGGTFGYGETALNSTFDPVCAAVSGITKTVSREWPNVIAKILDFNPLLTTDQISALLELEVDESVTREILETRAGVELQGDNNRNERERFQEFGYNHEEQRSTLELLAKPLNIDEDSIPFVINKDSVILVTGGARGITATICLELAEKYKPTFVIVGRGKYPDLQETEEFIGSHSAKELKAKIIEKLKQEGEQVNISIVETLYKNLLKKREIKHNLQLLEDSGARVKYHALDVRDEIIFSEFIDTTYQTYGRIDGVIHGAGIIEDALIKDKSLISFDRVLTTKVNSAFTLAKKLQFDSLQFLCFFSSVVAHTGNAGQVDYVAANEVLNKLALYLSNQYKTRIVSFGWGPWRGGMVQPEMESIFAKYGWSMIHPKDGQQTFVDELLYGDRNDVDVLLVGQLVKQDVNNEKATAFQLATTLGARLSQAKVMQSSNMETELHLSLDTNYDLYLKDHSVDDVPVLPMAMAAELFLEAAQVSYPESYLTRIEKLDIPAGIVFETDAKDIILKRKVLETDKEKISLSMSLQTFNNMNRSNFRCQVVLSDESYIHKHVLLPLQYENVSWENPLINLPSIKMVYKNWLFHGPLFQGIQSIDTIGYNGISGSLEIASIQNCLNTIDNVNWSLNPILLDSAMQLAGIWARQYLDITVLPTGFRSLTLLRVPQGKDFKAIVSIQSNQSKSNELYCDLSIYESNGNLVLLLEGLTGVGSKSLNRLGVQKKALRLVQ